jgi:hypothetical protein
MPAVTAIVTAPQEPRSQIRLEDFRAAKPDAKRAEGDKENHGRGGDGNDRGPGGERKAASVGSAAPPGNAAGEAKAARMGFAAASSVRPSCA